MRTFIFLATLFLGITTPLFASAATIQINPNLPGVEGATDLVSIVVNIYQTALLVGAFLAFGSIVYGAATYALAEAGFAKSEARERITNAVIGLLLLAAAYLLLYTINPALTILTNPGLEEVAVIKSGASGSGGSGTPTPIANAGCKGSATCQNSYLKKTQGVSCSPSSAVSAAKSCLEKAGLSISATTDGDSHDTCSCHYGGIGANCKDGHALDISQDSDDALKKAKNALINCSPLIKDSDCGCELVGERATCGVNADHIHCNINLSTDGCQCDSNRF